MTSDLLKHPETNNHHRTMLGYRLKLEGRLSTAEEMRDFITGFK
jgi:hypothetical protein